MVKVLTTIPSTRVWVREGLVLGVFGIRQNRITVTPVEVPIAHFKRIAPVVVVGVSTFNLLVGRRPIGLVVAITVEV